MKILAFYLPQFHPIEENNQWWGNGFTEWTNVTKSVPRFKWHVQPRLPADLGFYDLRNTESIVAQTELAKQYGVDGFVFYHYWFNGKRLLNTPIDNFLSNPQVKFPFCFCWANENWTRRWDGMESHVLISQNYRPEDDKDHINFLISVFKDERYIKIDGKPVLLIYRVSSIPEFEQTSKLWRKTMIEHGFPGIYIIKVESFPEDKVSVPSDISCDAGLEFSPDRQVKGQRIGFSFYNRILKGITDKNPYVDNLVFSYQDLAVNSTRKKWKEYPWFRSVCPGWDNSPRRSKNAFILKGNHPDIFKNWLFSIQKLVAEKPYPENEFVFINSWNEWAEGAHLEPDNIWGHQFLESVRLARSDSGY